MTRERKEGTVVNTTLEFLGTFLWYGFLWGFVFGILQSILVGIVKVDKFLLNLILSAIIVWSLSWVWGYVVCKRSTDVVFKKYFVDGSLARSLYKNITIIIVVFTIISTAITFINAKNSLEKQLNNTEFKMQSVFMTSEEQGKIKTEAQNQFNTVILIFTIGNVLVLLSLILVEKNILNKLVEDN
ncbi:MAG: hypothetical protein A2Y24_01240 [Clostridiales bacterium GWE2_32_10]|nr:MAG: hypothetical protein A2Y24_01240 [Clostridiales bacterium GWE2_32_10]HBY21309.1 hypothetical protein [Clostridiales bacterium]